MTVLAEHVTAPGVVSMARQQEPDALVWAVRADGQLATLTADRDQAVFAWSRQVTQGNFECVETVPTPDGDRLFAVVRRHVGGVGVRSIQLLQPAPTTAAAPTRPPEPDALVWAVRADGQLATLTADRDQEVFAWSRQVTQGNFECVETVPTPDGDRLFAVVRRIVGGVGVRYIEMLDPDLNTDAALTGTSEAGATVWTGLDHLEGLTVTVKGDGVALQDRVVTGGQITIERPANAIEVGLRSEEHT